MMMPADGKSGPGTSSINSSTVGLGRRFFITSSIAAAISPRLCVGMLVAMPTAIPLVPLTNRLGSRPGMQIGSVLSPS